jgi:hypothetical protein
MKAKPRAIERAKSSWTGAAVIDTAKAHGQAKAIWTAIQVADEEAIEAQLQRADALYADYWEQPTMPEANDEDGG